jgi:hypothetical protein
MVKVVRFKIFGLNLFVLFIVVAIIAGVGLWLYNDDKEANKTVITSDTLTGGKVLGRVVKGSDSANAKNKLATADKELIYESRPINTNKPTTTAAVVSWGQQGNPDHPPALEMRVENNGEWSKWMDVPSDQDDRKDGTPPKNSGIIISKDIGKVQYRLALTGPSPEIDLSSIKIETIDTSKGPSLSRKTAWQKIGETFGFGIKTAKARLAGPPINSRLVWGSPEPYGSPGWTPEYQPLNRVVIHHTATTPQADSSAAVRAIWQYHTYTQGWGDIGYNYLVDQAGNIFQGRFFDGKYAEEHNVDVVGGHTYGNNEGTTGIAALGDFTNDAPSASLVHWMGELAAYKGGPYGLNPAGGETYGGNLLGHRDLYPTGCPGATLYSQLPTIRNVANAVFPRYYVPPYSWQYLNQFAFSDPARQVPIDLNGTPVITGRKIYLTLHARNTGTKTWYPSGPNPVRLGTSNPQDRPSSTCDTNSWITCARAANIAEPSVAPGQIGSFQFSVVVPYNIVAGSAVRLNEYFSPLAEGATWFNNPGLYWGFTIEKPFAWQYVHQYAYTDAAHQNPIDLNTTPVNGGQSIYLRVEAQNTGSRTWTPDGPNPVRLGTSNPQDRASPLYDNASWITPARVVNISQPTVAPGEIGSFDFKIKVPINSTGKEKEYREYFNPLSEGIVWFNNPGLFWIVRVAP